MTDKTINTSIEILGKLYPVRCLESEVKCLQQAAALLNQEMSDIKESGKVINLERIAIVSESTSSVTVRDRPSNVNLIGQYINNINHNLSKQVLVKIQVLEINLENSFTFGVDWALIAKAFNKSPFVVNANYGTPISITNFGGITTPQFGFNPAQDPSSNKIPSYKILLSALNQQGKNISRIRTARTLFK